MMYVHRIKTESYCRDFFKCFRNLGVVYHRIMICGSQSPLATGHKNCRLRQRELINSEQQNVLTQDLSTHLNEVKIQIILLTLTSWFSANKSLVKVSNMSVQLSIKLAPIDHRKMNRNAVQISGWSLTGSRLKSGPPFAGNKKLSKRQHMVATLLMSTYEKVTNEKLEI